MKTRALSLVLLGACSPSVSQPPPPPPDASIADVVIDHGADTSVQCGASVVDVATDPKNCGRCGRDCLGATCSGGMCAPIVLADNQDGPQQIVTDGVAVYWVNLSLMRCGVGGCNDQPMALSSLGYQMRSLAIDATNLYWTSNTGVFLCATAGCGNPTTIALDAKGPTYIAVSAPNVAWANGSGEVSACPTSGCVGDAGTPTLLATSQTIAGMTADATNVYWVSGSDIVVCPFAGCGGAPTKIASNQVGARGIAVDATNVYWTIFNEPGQVMSCALAGCASPTTLATNQYYPKDIKSDGTNVYWTNYGPPVYYGGQIRTCATTGCGGDAGILASPVDRPAENLAVDDAAVYWTDNILQVGQIMKVAK